MARNLKTRIILNFLAAFFLMALTGEYGNTRINLVETLEKQSYDWRLQREESVKQTDIVIVDIDRDTLRAFGNWPLPRNLFAQLNEQLFKKYRVRIAAYAFPFSDRDDTAIRLLDDIQEDFNNSGTATGRLAFSNILQQTFTALRRDYDYDRHIMKTLDEYPVALGYVFDETGRVQGALPKPIELTDRNNSVLSENYLHPMTAGWPSLRGYSGNLGEYLSAASNIAGHINFTEDEDGVVRRAPYFIRHAGGYYPSLPLAVYQQLQNQNKLIADVNSDSLFSGRSIENIIIGNYSIPTNRSGNMYINYLGVGGRNVDFFSTPSAVFPYVSFADVVEGRVPQDMLDDKIVFVGSSSAQLRLVYPTPHNSSLPGVEILATQLANLMDKNILQRGDDAFAHETLLLLTLVVVLSLLFATTGPIYSGLALVAAVAGYVFFVRHVWETNNEIWTMVPTLITLTGLFISNTIIGFIFEWRASRHLESTFGQYVPPEFAKKIGASGDNINLEGEVRELSILFSDVRNFTAMSEKLSPRELTLLMNRMLTDLTQAIHKHGGTVDKYIGDAIMAFWNAPLYDEGHAKRSVLAAIDMQATMLNLSAELEKKGFDPIRLGVGICTGDANVGNMGSSLRMTYTAIGDTVNLASRTESLTKFYQCPILITETTREQCGDDITFRAVDLVRVKGRQEPVLLYQPIGLSHQVPAEQLTALEKFEQMRQLYVAGSFTGAREQLAAYRLLNPHDPLSDLYEERLELLIKQPPPAEEWDGIMSHKTK